MTHRPQSWRMVNPAECESLRENWCYSTFPRLLKSDFQNHPSWSSCCSLSPNPISDPEPKRRRSCGAQSQPPAENPCWDKSTYQHGQHFNKMKYACQEYGGKNCIVCSALNKQWYLFTAKNLFGHIFPCQDFARFCSFWKMQLCW